MNVLVLGASRGIGLELVRQSLAAGDQVVATARDEAGVTRLAELGATALTLDVADAASCAGLAWSIDGTSFDEAWLVAGITGPHMSTLHAPAQSEFDAVMHTNVLAAMRLLPMVTGHLAPGARLVALSSRMGSIGARTASSVWLYRASKAALNSVVRDVALSVAGRAVCVALHPGWVRTDMGGANAEVDVERSVAGMRATVARLQPSDNGHFLDHQGQTIPW